MLKEEVRFTLNYKLQLPLSSGTLSLLGVFFSSWRHSAWSSFFLELTFNVVERLAGLLGAGWRKSAGARADGQFGWYWKRDGKVGGVEERKTAAAARQTRSIPWSILTFGAEEDDGHQQDQADDREDHTHHSVHSCVPGCLFFLLFEYERRQKNVVNATQQCSPWNLSNAPFSPSSRTHNLESGDIFAVSSFFLSPS